MLDNLITWETVLQIIVTYVTIYTSIKIIDRAFEPEKPRKKSLLD